LSQRGSAARLASFAGRKAGAEDGSRGQRAELVSPAQSSALPVPARYDQTGNFNV